MTDRKFTDEDIRDSLRYHASRSLARCCQCAYLECNENCTELLAKDALDLINRQKADIENLINALCNSTKEFLKLHDEYKEQKAEIEELKIRNERQRHAIKVYQIDETKAEAIKEFVGLLETVEEVVVTLNDETITAVDTFHIHRIAKKMMGE